LAKARRRRRGCSSCWCGKGLPWASLPSPPQGHPAGEPSPARAGLLPPPAGTLLPAAAWLCCLGGPALQGRAARLLRDWRGGAASPPRRGEAFQTSGCPGCNRPYYNERPGGFIYNYPRPLSAAETAAALGLMQEENRQGRGSPPPGFDDINGCRFFAPWREP